MMEATGAYSSMAEEGNLVYGGLAAQLTHAGGIDWLEDILEGCSNLAASNKARRDIFLQDKEYENDRHALLTSLEIWQELLGACEEMNEMLRYCFDKAEEQQAIVQRNLLGVTQSIKPVEESYRGVSLFFENAESDQLSNISFINCDISQLVDLTVPRFFDHIGEELKMNFDRIDLRNNYSLLLLPGYLGNNAVVEKWAKLACDNKVLIITDFENLDEADDVMEVFEASGLAGGDPYKASVLVCCNWLVGRGKHDVIHEEDDLFIPPSLALGGKIYRSLLSQVAAGKKFGVINGVDGVKFPLKKSEVSVLEKMNLVPMFSEYGKVMAFSAKTLFNGANLGLQIYSVVRVFDHVAKVLMDFLNRRAFENFNANIRKELMGQVVKFLDGVSGNGKLIEDFSIRRFEQDAEQKDKIHLDIHLKPYFPAKNFMIKMEGKKGEDGHSWDTSYDQQ
ncbi:MAG TPA: hypothetical protein VL943_14055 [Niabella sp.]|nr:hypothetical protein [Niabella sp.]